jgi:protein tyrosine/serine phosphatase
MKKLLPVFLVSIPISQLAFSTSFHLSDAHSSPSAASFSFAQKISVRGVPNAGKVSEQLFRGAQPHLANLRELKKLGITTIVDLRGEASRTRQAERARAESLGMRFVSVPVGPFSNPSSSQLAAFFSLVRQTPPEKIFVHCQYGEDRTGVFIAAYRIAFDHWSAEQALAEMKSFGFNHSWHPSMITFVRGLPARLESDPVLKSSLR